MNFFYLLIIIVIFILFISGIVFIKTGGFFMIRNKINPPSEKAEVFEPVYLDRTSLFEILPKKPDSIVFLGDSLIARCNWNELFENDKIINRGIDSDTTFGILNRMKQITDKNPKSIFIMIGINDIKNNVTLTESISNYEKIILTVKKDSPNTTIHILSILPVNESSQKCRNSNIVAFNAQLKSLSQKYDVRYVDLYHLFSMNNSLLPEVTYDGIHLNGNGYTVWKDAIYGFI